MSASTQAFWVAPPLRPLLIRLPPFPNETARSYVRRLEAANHLSIHGLDEQLRDPATPGGPLVPQRLAAITGWPPRALQHACLSFVVAARSAWAAHYRALPGFDPTPRAACRRCVAGRGIAEEVTCWVAPNANVCLRHRRWIGPTNRTTADQFDLGPLPEIAVAARRYRRLAQRLGDHRVGPAYYVALHITLRWADRGDLGQHRDRRLRVLGFEPDPVWPDRIWLPAYHPALWAATYPDTVTLAGLLASPHWLEVAASPAHQDHRRFYVEVARRLRLPDYQPCMGWDPLARWIDRHAPQQAGEGPHPFREERRCWAPDAAPSETRVRHSGGATTDYHYRECARQVPPPAIAAGSQHEPPVQVGVDAGRAGRGQRGRGRLARSWGAERRA